MRRMIRRLLLVVALLGIGLGAGALAYPAAAAVACPSCFGFRQVASRLYVDDATTPSTQNAIVATVATARGRVGGFYGHLDSAPRILICATAACYERVGGGGSRGMALLDVALLIAPRGADPVILAHEMAHIELHHRLGLAKTLGRAIPQWFDEGLAVTVSDDPRYLAPAGRPDRCLIASDEPLPTQRRAWIETAASRDLYAKAACRVSRWLVAKGGAPAVLRLLDGLAAGQSFDALYKPPPVTR